MAGYRPLHAAERNQCQYAHYQDTGAKRTQAGVALKTRQLLQASEPGATAPWAIAGFHYISVCGPTGTGEISGLEFTEQRTMSANGDHAWFIRKMVSLALADLQSKEAMHEIFFSTSVRARHTENYAKTFNKLLKTGGAVDTDDMVVDALLNGSAEGLYHRVILHTKGEISLDMVGAPPPPDNIAASS